MTLKTFYFFLFLFALKSFCQNNEYINSDRPDQSEGTYIVSKGNFQFESGFLFDEEELINNLMIRFGIASNLEIRFINDFNLNTKNNLFGLSFKSKIMQQNGVLPEITIVGYLKNLHHSNKVKQNFSTANTSLFLAFQNQISNTTTLCYNLGIQQFGKDYFSSVLISKMTSSNISLYLEYYNFINKSASLIHNFDCGFFYFIKPNFQLDFAIGKTIAQNEKPYFSVGMAYCLPN